jgi:anti-sigma B factor antagonist
LLLLQEGAAMFSVDLSISECGAGVVVALRGELDIADAAGVAAALAAVAARKPDIVLDLAGLEFIDSSGVAALARGRKHARRAGGDLRLAAPQQQVLRVLTLTRLVDAFPVHASVDEAAGRAGLSRRVADPAAGDEGHRDAPRAYRDRDDLDVSCRADTVPWRERIRRGRHRAAVGRAGPAVGTAEPRPASS